MTFEELLTKNISSVVMYDDLYYVILEDEIDGGELWMYIVNFNDMTIQYDSWIDIVFTDKYSYNDEKSEIVSVNSFKEMIRQQIQRAS